MKLFVGNDVSSEKLDVCFLTDDDQLSILTENSVANDIERAPLTRELILVFNENNHFGQIVIEMELNVHVQLSSFDVFDYVHIIV
ncbi:Transposase IS116/IS110/IS902 family protein [Enterococcus faecium]|nr:Transposase IS116/IS110/IS902 family protein [Enterococcus faecium]